MNPFRSTSFDRPRRRLSRRDLRRGERRQKLEQLELRTLMDGDPNANPWHNYNIAADVNQDGIANSVDINILGNQLAALGAGELPAAGPGPGGFLLDVNNDFLFTQEDLDAAVQGILNDAEGEGEIVGVRVQFVNLSNAPISTVNFGSDFKLRVWIRDLRPDSPEIEPGIFAAFLDVTYDPAIVGFKGPFYFGATPDDPGAGISRPVTGQYNFLTSGDASTPGLLDEVGGGDTDFEIDYPLLGVELLLFEATFHAGAQADSFTVAEDSTTVFDVLANDTVAGSTTFATNGADSPASETLTWFPVEVVDPTTQFLHGSASITHTNNTVTNNQDYVITAVSAGSAGGALQITHGGKRITYTPAANFFGTETFTYTIRDGANRTDPTGTVTVNVTAVNDAPTAVLDLRPTEENTPVVFSAAGLLANDLAGPANELSAPQNQTVSFVSVGNTTTAGGTVSYDSGTGNITYTPPANFTGNDSVQYTITDNGTTNGFPDPKTATGTIQFSVGEVNDPPTAGNDTASTNEDTPVVILRTALIANDSAGPANESGQTLTITNVTNTTPGGAGGTVTINAQGNVLYTPAANFNGTYTFTYTITDNGTTSGQPDPKSATATVTVTVNAVNDNPVPTNDTRTTAEDTPLTFAAATLASNDSPGPADESAQTLTVISVSGSSSQGGTVALVAGNITYTPPTNFVGTDTFTYVVRDNGTPNAQATGTVTVTVTAVNDAPTAVADTLPNSAEDTTVTIAMSTLTGNDVRGPADESGQTLTIIGVSATSTQGGTVTISGSNILYTPPANYFGPDSFTYTVQDNGQTNGVNDFKTAVGTVSLTVTPVNDPPTATNKTATTAEDTAVVLPAATLLAGATTGPANESAQVLSISAVSSPSAQGGTVSINGSGDVVYTPAANFHGSDTFTVTVRDNGQTNGVNDFKTTTLTVTVTVTEVNDAPTVQNKTAATNEDTPTTILLSTLLAGATRGPANENGQTLTLTNVAPTSAGGTVAINGSGDVDFTPAADFFGAFTFSYTLTDNGTTNGAPDAKSATGTVTITVNAVNDPPVAGVHVLTTAEDTQLAVSTASLIALDAPGPANESSQAVVFGAASSPSANGGTVAVSSGTLRYTPPANFVGADTFTYTIRDNVSTTVFTTVTVTVNVTEVNDAPVAANDAGFSTNEDVALTIDAADLLANDTAGPANESAQTLTITGVSTSLAGATVQLIGNQIVFTPPADFNGNATFTYTVSDDGTTNGAANPRTATGTVTVAVLSVNDAPVPTGDARTTNEDTPLTFQASQLLTNDTNKGAANESAQTLTVTGVSATSSQGGTVTLSGGNITYTPPADFNGTDTFTYTVTDNGQSNGVNDFRSGTATVTVTVVRRNDAPLAVADDFTTDVDTPLAIPVANVLVNDSAGPNEGEQTLTVIAVGSASHGAVSFSGGVITYTPNAGYEGPDSFTYTIRDNGANGTQSAPLQAIGTINIDVFSGTPNARNDAFTVAEDLGPTLFNVQTNDSITDGGTAEITAVTQGTQGGLVEIVSGQIRYTPAANFVGQETFTYTLADGIGDPDVATVTVTVTAVNDAPVAEDDNATVAEDTAATFTIAQLGSNDSRGAANEAAQTLSFASFSATSAQGGTVQLVGGNLVYTPPANYVGPDSFTYAVSDNGLTNGVADPQTSNTATVHVTVTAVNDAPVGGADTGTTAEDTSLTLLAADLVGNDSPGPANEAGQALTIIGVSATSSQGGTVTLAGGQVTYTPAGNFVGVDTFTYTVRDNGQSNGVDDFKTAVVTVTVTVTEVNDAPTAANKTATTNEDAPLTLTAATLLQGATRGPANESGQTLAVDSVSATSSQGGTVAIVGGNVVYTPPADFSGTDTFTYTIVDNGTTNGAADPQSATATVTVTVRNINDPPIAGPDSLLVDEGTRTTIPIASLLANDNPGSGESFQSIAFVGAATRSAQGGTIRRSGNNLLYTPRTGYTGPDSFTYTIRDNGSPRATATGTVNIVVGEINDAPLAANDSLTINEDAVTVINALANDRPGPAGEANQTLTVTAFDATTAQGGTVTFDSGSGQFTYTPPADFFGTDSFTYTITDDGTTQGSPDPKSATATVNITIRSVNDAPVANADDAITTENTVKFIPIAELLANDTRGAANESAQSLTLTGVSAVSANGGAVAIVGSNIRYTPPADYQGSDSFTYTVRDNGSPQMSSTGTVNVAIGEVNTPPVGGADNAATLEDTVLNLLAADLLANDAAGPADESGQSLSVTGFAATSQQGGTVAFDGTTFTYTPPQDFVGTDSFTYTITDDGTTVGSPDPKSATVTVTINVAAANDAPVAENDVVQAVKGVNGQTLQVLGNDSPGPANESGQTLTIVAVSGGSEGGSLTISPDGLSLLYNPPSATFLGSETFTYTVRDNGQTNGVNDFQESTATVTVNVVDFLPVTISGKVYFELNGNRQQDANERPIGGVTITVRRITPNEAPVTLPPQQTLADGSFLFENLLPGTYEVVQTQPTLLADSQDHSPTAGVVQPSSSVDRFVFTAGPLDGTHAVVNFGEGNARVTYRTRILPLASGSSTGTVNGIEFGVRNNGAQHYFSLYDGWSLTKSASLVLSADLRTAVLTVVDLANASHTRNLDAASGHFTVIGTDKAGNYQVRLHGTAANYGITLGGSPEGEDTTPDPIFAYSPDQLTTLDRIFAKFLRQQRG